MKKTLFAILIILLAAAKPAAGLSMASTSNAEHARAIIDQADRADERVELLNTQLGAAVTLLSQKNDTIAAITKERDEALESKGRWFSYAGMLIGGLVTTAGLAGVLFINPSAGLKVLGLGLAITAMGFSVAYYAKPIAAGGLVIGSLGIVATVWMLILDVRRHRNAGIEIADGVQQAVISGAIDFAKVKAHFDQAQGPLAKKIVNEATK